MPRTVVTSEHIEFAQANCLNMTAADIDKKFGTSKGVTRRIYKKFTFETVISLAVFFNNKVHEKDNPVI